MRWWVIAVAAALAAPTVRADEPKTVPTTRTDAPTVLVPYRLTRTQHVLVRAKINGKGPFNFILDTGAPALFVAKKVADGIGVTADKRGRATFDRFEVEGGV